MEAAKLTLQRLYVVAHRALLVVQICLVATHGATDLRLRRLLLFFHLTHPQTVRGRPTMRLQRRRFRGLHHLYPRPRKTTCP